MEPISTNVLRAENNILLPKAIAVLSGKGGSGKTMLTALMASILDHHNIPVVVVDADTGTAGMTYYLGVTLVHNIKVGLSTVARSLSNDNDALTSSEVKAPIVKINNLNISHFCGVGDHRRLMKEVSEDKLPTVLKGILDILRREHKESVILVDCRGGIDKESIAVCSAVDDILLIAEPDTTSFQATEHLVSTLSENDLAHKIRGFILNKVFDDPTDIARIDTTAFGSQHLCSIPLDIEATRDFLKGEVPSQNSILGIHVQEALFKAFPDIVSRPEGRPWSPVDFHATVLARQDTLRNLDSIRGGVVVAGLILVAAVTWFITMYFLGHSNTVAIVIALVFFGFIGSLQTTRLHIGKFVDSYIRYTSNLMFGVVKK